MEAGVIEAALAMFAEFRLMEGPAAEELPDRERLAYQEGILRSMQLLSLSTGVVIRDDSLSQPGMMAVEGGGGRSSAAYPGGDGSESTLRGADSGDTVSVCPDCGEDRIRELGSEAPICLHCRSLSPG